MRDRLCFDLTWKSVLKVTTFEIKKVIKNLKKLGR